MFCIDAFKEFTTSKSYLCFEYDRLTSKELSGFDRLLRKVFGCYANTRLSHIIRDGYTSSLSASRLAWDPDLQNQWFCLVHKYAPSYAHEIPSYQLGDKVVHLHVTYSLNDIVADRHPNAAENLEDSIKSNLQGGVRRTFSPVLETRIQGWIRDWALEAARARIEGEITSSIVELQSGVAPRQDEMARSVKRHLEDWHNTPTVRKINFVMFQIRTEGGNAPLHDILTVQKRAGKLSIRSQNADNPFGHEPRSLAAQNACFTSDQAAVNNHLAAKIISDSEGLHEIHCNMHDYGAIGRKTERARAQDPGRYRQIDEQQRAFDSLPTLEGRRLLQEHYDQARELEATYNHLPPEERQRQREEYREQSRRGSQAACPRPAQIPRAPNYGYDDLPASLQTNQEERMRELGWEIDRRPLRAMPANRETIPYCLHWQPASAIAAPGSTSMGSHLSLAFALPLLDDIEQI